MTADHTRAKPILAKSHQIDHTLRPTRVPATTPTGSFEDCCDTQNISCCRVRPTYRSRSSCILSPVYSDTTQLNSTRRRYERGFRLQLNETRMPFRKSYMLRRLTQLHLYIVALLIIVKTSLMLTTNYKSTSNRHCTLRDVVCSAAMTPSYLCQMSTLIILITWHTQELKYNWQVEITGTGSRSLVF